MSEQVHAIGKLQLVYGTTTRLHVCSFGLLKATTPYDQSNLEPEAAALAEFVAAVLPVGQFVFGWRTTNQYNKRILDVTFDTSVPTDHLRNNNYTASMSSTLSFTGKTASPTVGEPIGQTRTMLFVENAFAWNRGEKQLLHTSDSTLAALAGKLRSSTLVWGDFYGEKADVHGYCTVQFNSFAQNHWGQ